MKFVEDILLYIIGDKIIQLQSFIELIRSLKADDDRQIDLFMTWNCRFCWKKRP